MEVAARVPTKGQVTVPKAVRDALGVNEGGAGQRWRVLSSVGWVWLISLA